MYYRGNLSTFVSHHPEAKSYYTLAATSVKFSFPPPGSLMGVRSNTRAILKMSNCTYTYPGRDKPSLIEVSCALSLSRSVFSCYHGLSNWSRITSRVGIVGPNGAGKSTLIKLLTVVSSLTASLCEYWHALKGETEPQQGAVYRHPSLRIGYVSQHATHHIGKVWYLPDIQICLQWFQERHLEKTPIQYIQWRYQDGHDREYDSRDVPR